MKTKFAILSILSALSLTVAHAEDNTIYTYSTIDALLSGAYDGNLTLSDLKKEGNFGLGTYNKLDGEMILLNGKFYHAHSDGKVDIDPDSSKTPLAYVTSFNDNTSMHVDSLTNLSDLSKIEAAIDSKLPNLNYFYAVKIEGTFNHITTRAIPPQNKPYKPLAELVKIQSVFNADNIEGTLVGFRSPAFSKGISVPGYHWHFISKDEKFGGHVLKADLKAADAKIQPLTKVDLQLPDTEEFSNSNQNKDRTQELHSVETLRK